MGANNTVYDKRKILHIEIQKIGEYSMWHRIIDFANLEKKYGEGTKFDLDYGKLLIIFLCVYIAVKVS